MNKKLMIILHIFFASLYACTYISGKPGVTEVSQVKTAYYDSIPWDESAGDFTDRLNINSETVLKVAELLLLNTVPEQLKDKSPFLSYVEDKNIYAISYLSDKNHLGGDVNIALDAKTGKVLKMWAGE